MPNLLPDLLGRAGTDGGSEAHKHQLFPTADQARSKAVAQEVELPADLGSWLLLDVAANDLGLFDTQVQLPPGSAPAISMLSNVPFTRTVDSQAGGIHNHVPRPTARTDGQQRRQGTLPSTDSAVVWNWKWKEK